MKSTPMSSNLRIAYIDGLRCLAIVAVICYHYLYRWTSPASQENLYPYGATFSALGEFGNRGVPLFFIVSGFVITMTLCRCSSALEFAVRRFARLWPSLLLCSVLTATLVRIIPNHDFNVPLLGFVPSLTFLSPNILRPVLHVQNLTWIDGVYWSLFVEARFYVLIALVFFLFKRRFPQALFAISGVILLLNLGGTIIHLHKLVSALNLFAGTTFMPWFMMGIAFFWFHGGVNRRLGMQLMAMAVGALVIMGVNDKSVPEIVSALVVPSIFQIGRPGKPLHRLFSNRLVTSIGISSYSLYLLHQNIGVALISYLGQHLHWEGKSSVVIAIAVVGLMIACSKAVYVFWENPMNRRIVNWASRTKPAQDTTHLITSQPKIDVA